MTARIFDSLPSGHKEKKNRNVCIIAGEASGDAQGSLLVRALRKLIEDSQQEPIDFWGSAGPLLRQEGVEAIVHAEDLAVFGASEIWSHYTMISDCYKKLRRQIEVKRPTAVVLIDYPGFNVRLLQDIFDLGLKAIYYIPPKVWSHGLHRLETLKKYTNLIISVLPFEVPFFNRHGINVQFIGNPLKDAVDAYRQEHLDTEKVPYQIALLPGSRVNEVKRLLPVFIESFILLHKSEPRVKAKLPIAHTLDPNFVKQTAYKAALALGYPAEWVNRHIEFLVGKTYEAMHTSAYAWVCSGTAALETAFFHTPHCIAYRVTPLTYLYIRLVISVPHVSLVNLIAGEPVTPEFLQQQATPANLFHHALEMLQNQSKQQSMVQKFRQICDLFPKNSAQNAAAAVFECLGRQEQRSRSLFCFVKE